MNADTTRRALLGAILGGGVAAGSLSPVRGYLERFAPFSGAAWRQATDDLNGTVESPHGPAELRYDDRGVPHVTADDERALYFAAGYAAAADRLFQMDLQRRVMGGEVSAVVGDAALDSDEFHVRMDFAGAADATWDLVRDTDTGPVVAAYADGVNAYVENEALPMEFGLLDYEPDPWRPADTMLMEKQISWTLTGSFGTLRKATAASELGEEAAESLYPARLDHDVPILRERGNREGRGDGDRADRDASAVSPGSDRGEVDAPLVDWLGRFESPPGVGSNSWVVSGEHTESGAPVVANDPHLSLMAPPVWYEMHLRGDGVDVRGATFPGVPFVVIGENDAGAWGFTNVGADVIDFYEYETDGETYRYRGEEREFETESREIKVADGENREVTVKKSVHGPVIEREGYRVGVAWTGHAATRTTVAIREYAHSEGVDAVREATRKFDLPTQNLVYADRDGRTLYQVTGQIPIRRVDGEVVRGDRLFDGSAGEGEWDGFEPFAESSWDGFVPFEDKPAAVDAGYVATANQRVADDPEYYLGVDYASPYRGRRIYDRLDRRAASDDPVTPAFVADLQRDSRDGRAADLVPELVGAAEGREGLADAVDALRDWDYRMTPDSRAALLFSRWFDRFRERAVDPVLDGTDLGEEYYPRDWVVATLPDEDPWFGDERRSAAMATALADAVEATAADATYGDVNHTGAVTHPFDRDFLNYPEHPTAGSRQTVNNFRAESAVGSSWRMICPMAGDSRCVLPGGNSGDPLSEHYDDQLRMWADGEYREMELSVDGDLAVAFEEGDG
ncbi:penicillin acylase family protein [Halostella sp. JP-L12]|uniref:penicillin acylase family protein n=1 Tax=Halostella TaxID=1843185 RepID=UPI000EF81EAC|nr:MULTISPECIES: penicillin acylase family protein [Halostella]NHN48994.1 penicillin acylase family protein [Halostella sp. JP-L12]